MLVFIRVKIEWEICVLYLIFSFLHFPIHIRRKYWNPENFELSVFDEFHIL